MTAITVAAVLTVSLLVFWQRSRRSDRGIEAYRTGETLLAQGRVDEAVLAFRNALAHTPQNARVRVALGLALFQSGHPNEASAYLSEAARVNPSSGLAWMGLAQIALARGEQEQALKLIRQALSRGGSVTRRSAQVDHAGLLSETGRRSETISLLLTMIEQRGDDPAIGKRAADMVRAVGSPEQTEEAYAMLASRFSEDSSVWLRVGDAGFSAGKERLALDGLSACCEG